MNQPAPQFLPASDRSLLVKFGDVISEEYHASVVRLSKTLSKRSPKSVTNIHPGYSSVLISFDPLRTNHRSLERQIRLYLDSPALGKPAKKRFVEIPVCYGDDFGPDLSAVASQCGLSKEEVIHVHASAEYKVYFLGFSPGFAYLGGMSGRIAVPRLSVPRKTVPAGSVAIGGNQTGVYPIDSPGGWQIIGRTSLQLFNAARKQPVLLQIGDDVKFRPIAREEFKIDSQGS